MSTRPVICRQTKRIPPELRDESDVEVLCRSCGVEVLIGWDIQLAISKNPRGHFIVCEECYSSQVRKGLKILMDRLPPAAREKLHELTEARLSMLLKGDGSKNTIGGIDEGLLR